MNDNFIDFEVDHAYVVDVDEIAIDDPDQLILNGNFEHGTLGWEKSGAFDLKTGQLRYTYLHCK